MGKKKGANRDTTNGAIPGASVTISIGKHIRKAIGTKGDAGKELTAIPAIDARGSLGGRSRGKNRPHGFL